MSRLFAFFVALAAVLPGRRGAARRGDHPAPGRPRRPRRGRRLHAAHDRLRPSKPERVVEMKGWKKGDDQGLVRYTAPAKERGTAYLRSGENTRLCLPSARAPRGAEQASAAATSRTRHLPALAHQGLRPDARGEETAEGQACYSSSCRRRTAPSRRTGRLLGAQRGTFHPVRVDYDTSPGRPEVVSSSCRPSRSAGRTWSTPMTMENWVLQGSSPVARPVSSPPSRTYPKLHRHREFFRGSSSARVSPTSSRSAPS